MNFRDLEYVIQTAKTLSFSQAAEACNVSQPSLSAQIKKLEEELGAALFIRSKRKVHLTSFGAQFLERAKQILDIRDDMFLIANESKNPLEGKITLGAILTVAPYMFPKIVHHLRSQAPKIELTLKEAKTEELLKGLLEGHVDAAIISLPTDDNVFESQHLFSERFHVAVAENHVLSQKTEITVQDLTPYEMVLLEEGHCFRAQALDVCYSAAAQENTMFKATSLETIKHFIASGEAITLMPEMACQEADTLRYIPLKDKKFMRDIGIIWRKSCVKKPQIEKLISLIQN